MFFLWYKFSEVTFESRNGNITGSQKVVTACSIVWKVLNPKKGSVLFENTIEIMSSAMSPLQKKKMETWNNSLLENTINWYCLLTNKFLLIPGCSELSVSLLTVPFCATWVLYSGVIHLLRLWPKTDKNLTVTWYSSEIEECFGGVGEKKDVKYGTLNMSERV